MANRSNPLAPSTQNENLPSDDGSRSKAVHSVTQRLQKELMSLMMNSEKTVSAFPEGENLFNWVATIEGPVNTVYNGYTYKLVFEFPKNYPYSPPVVKFSSKCYHPNVDTSGNICLDILKDKWSASYDVRSVLLSIQSLLGDPNILSPLNVDAAEKWANEEEYKKALVAFQNNK